MTQSRRTTAKRTAKNKAKSKTYYSAASAAYELNDYEYETASPAQRTKKKLKPRAKPKQRVKRGTKYKYELGQNTHLFFTYFAMCLIFVGCLSFTLVMANITFKQREINSLKLELKKVSETNVALQAEMSEKLNLAEIEEIAKHKLGMALPEQNQTVYINPSNKSHIEHEGDFNEESNKFSLAAIRNILFKKD